MLKHGIGFLSWASADQVVASHHVAECGRFLVPGEGVFAFFTGVGPSPEVDATRPMVLPIGDVALLLFVAVVSGR